MQYLLILLLISTAVFSWFINFKGKFGAFKLVQYLLSLFAVCTFFQTMNLLTSEASLFLLSLLTVNFGLSFIKKLANTKFHLPLVVLSYGIVLLFENPALRFGEYEINFKSYESALIFIVSALLSLIVTWKTKFLGKFFRTGYKNERSLSRSIYFFLLGILMLVGYFMQSVAGPLVVFIGVVISILYMPRNETQWNVALALIPLLLIPSWMNLAGIELIQFDLGRSFAGLFFGFSFSYLAFILGRSRAKTQLANALVFGVCFGFPIALILAASQNVNFGGADTFALLFVGYGIAAASGINVRRNNAFTAGYMAIGLLFIPMIEQPTLELQEAQANRTTEKGANDFDLPTLPGTTVGDFFFNEENSKVDFELGPKGGRTKGAFKKFSGTLQLMAEGENSKLEVVFPMEQITTFNNYRDESLRDATYFNVSKFPTATYTAEGFSNQTNDWKIEGKLKLMGVELKVPIDLKRIESKEKAVLVGKATFDRTLFGMKPDPKEGNVVDLTFVLNLSENQK